ncbi:MAG TPA: ADOP family duplicated permease, partial [Gemmatimonadaceae bacterium]|nr:ADOP family duplicated permease [Gemmatimonadaceae bacterium]
MNITRWDRVRAFAARARESLHRRRIMTELDDELETHLELETAYNVRHGMPAAEAARAAKLALGGRQTVREQVGDARGFRALDHFVRDAKFALRQLRRTPAFTASMALTLAIGIGATTAVFAVLDSVLLRPLPYRDANRLVGVWWSLPGMGFLRAPQSASTYFAIRRLSHSFDGVAVFDRTAVNVATHAGDEHAERVNAVSATASLFTLLGAPFVVGRPFTTAEDVPNATPVVVIGEGFWRRRFGADPHIVGTQVRIDGQARTIVGVARASFHFPDHVTEVWTPIALDSAAAFGGAFGHQAFARLEPGVTPDDAQRELTRLIPRMGELYPNIAPAMPLTPFLQQAHAGIVVRPMRDDIIGGFGGVAFIAAAAGALLFIIALANAASLLLTRAEGRRRELALRVVLGASTGRVLAQFLAESLLLGTLGGLAGLAIAIVGIEQLVRAAPQGIPRLSEIALHPAAIVFAIAVAVLMAFACSAIAALRLNVRNLGVRLREGTRGGTAARDRQRARRTLVVTQVAFATVLVSGAAFLLQNAYRLRRADPGFDAAHALTAWVSLPTVAYPHDSDVVRYMSRLVSRVSQIPGVTAAGVSNNIPLFGLGQTYTPVWSDADPGTSTTLPPSDLVVISSGGFLGALGIPLVAGRDFYPTERQSAYEAIVDRSLARLYWGDSTGARAVGRRIRLSKDPASDSWYTIVGVVASVADTSLSGPGVGVIYLPNVVSPDSNRSVVSRVMALTVRSTGDPRAIRPFVERAIAEVDASVPPFRVKPMADVLRDSTARLWFMVTILTTTATIALLLAAIGLYGVLSYIVNARTKEMSIRIAMGAIPARVAMFVTRQGAMLAGTGVVIGAVAFLLLARYIESLVSGLSGPA